ncbi:MAG TPA: AAA family ATPase [Saprospiraceae bacterium]|nr:AAA family ATPase [Saprospiraceae bacterium]HPI05323.1 AAA family ATPase [Saprospiraceae bacterium]
MGINTIRIQNFKSIRDSGDVAIHPLNILIGANGVGKSNFISFFKFLNQLFEQHLQLYINQHGRADNFLYFGRKRSEFLSGEIVFDNEWQNNYEFKLVPDQNGNLIFAEEHVGHKSSSWIFNRGGTLESQMQSGDSLKLVYLRKYFSTFKIFHFHDTSINSKIKQPSGSRDYAYFQEDGGNLAAYLYRLQEAHPDNFKLIERTIQSVAPFFDKFYLQPDEINGQQIFLRWIEKGSDQLFTAHNFSDGTLRIICLVTLLLQPTPPSTIIIDEPELGLHPFAIEKLAAMLKSASQKAQIIISTQSTTLLNHFDAEDVLVVDRRDEQSTFRRLEVDELSDWLAEYSLSDLWDKNLLGGRP